MDFDALSRIPTLRTKLAYIPFLGAVGGYRIGVKPLEGPWIIYDEDRHVQLAMKRELLLKKCQSYRHTHPSYQARLEAAAMLCRELPMPKGKNLHYCSAEMQDDLAIMEKSDGEWRMTAASICFPSNWVLKDKFEQPSNVIHAQVGDDKFRKAIHAGLDKVTEEIVERFNWALDDTFTLRHPEPGALQPNPLYLVPGLTKRNAGSKLFIRYERQTLRRLPETGALLFTVRVFADPLRHLKEEDPQYIPDFVKAYKRHKTQGPWCGPMFEYLEA